MEEGCVYSILGLAFFKSSHGALQNRRLVAGSCGVIGNES
jgi:hypothetical protein